MFHVAQERNCPMSMKGPEYVTPKGTNQAAYDGSDLSLN